MSGASESEDTASNNHHPEYYFGDGSAIFQLNFRGIPGVLYKLHSSVLGSRSGVFSTMFSLPRGPGADPSVIDEGTSDSNPIMLPYIVSQYHFDHLLCYFYKGPTMHPKTDAFLVSVLSLSTFFEIDDGIAHAVQKFELKEKGFDPALQFELARLYRVDHWIRPAFERLMEISMTKLDTALMDRLGQAGYFWLVKTKADIEKHRKQFTFDTPSIQNDPDCNMPGYCGAAWYREWNMNVPKLIHHPEVHVSLVDFMKQMANTEITGLCDGCQKRTVTWIWGSGYPTKEQDYIDKAVAALMALQTDEPIRAAMRPKAVQSASPTSNTSLSPPPATTAS